MQGHLAHDLTNGQHFSVSIRRCDWRMRNECETWPLTGRMKTVVLCIPFSLHSVSQLWWEKKSFQFSIRCVENFTFSWWSQDNLSLVHIETLSPFSTPDVEFPIRQIIESDLRQMPIWTRTEWPMSNMICNEKAASTLIDSVRLKFSSWTCS